jgi:hypothetical protein
MASASLLAYLIASNFVDGLPLYRYRINPNSPKSSTAGAERMNNEFDKTHWSFFASHFSCCG